MSMWWRTVHIGSLKFGKWAAVKETVSLQQIQTIFQTTSSVYLIVIKSLDPLDIVGVIFSKSIDNVLATMRNDKMIMQKPVIQVDGLVSTNYELMPISGGVIGDLADAFARGSVCVILYRTSHILSSARPENNNEVINAIEKKHVIAAVTHEDLKRWIGEVESHHNMTDLNKTE